MKKLFTLSAAIFLMATVWAQSPQLMNYQAVVRNSSGVIVTTQIGMQISILQGSESGTVVYVETQTPTPNANGLVTVQIGALGVGFGDIDWSAGPYYIKTGIDPANGVNYSAIEGTSQLLSVPYALHARNGYTHYLGEEFGGGIVVGVWLDNGVEKGLIASLTDLGNVAWSDVTNVAFGAVSTVDGAPNTAAIIAGSTSGAAVLCGLYSNDGFTDWYLPAIWELEMCYNAAMWVNSILGQTNGFQFAAYWSSTENFTNPEWAWYKSFEEVKKKGDAAKTTLGKVRAVRRF